MKKADKMSQLRRQLDLWLLL